MTAKKFLAAVLLFFVAVNFGALVVKHLRRGGEFSEYAAAEKTASEIGEKVIVYYFHGRQRCDNCRNMEAYSKEAVRSGFEKQLAEGTIEWRAVDFDEPANRHFDEDFALGGIPSVVLVKMRDGNRLVWKSLPDVWELIASEAKPSFVAYLQREIHGFLRDLDSSRLSTAEHGNVRKPRIFAWGLPWALWLGIFTAITPCALMSNVAAVSYIGRRVDSPRQVVASGLLYALGQILAYTALGFVLVAGLLASSAVSSFLHRSMNELLGPLLILTAMFLLGLIEAGLSGLMFERAGISERLQKQVDAWGMWGAFFLGALFALTFCPVSGGLFFLQLVPQAAYLDSRLGLPALYGLGNALPVVLFAFLIAFSTQLVGKAFHRLTQIELWLRRLTGAIFLLLGIFYTFRYIFDLRMINLG
jgi:cytochrome c-type biogenesis protein